MLQWLQAVVGLWLILSPWTLGFKDISLDKWNVIIAGLVVFISALWSIYFQRSQNK